MNESNNEKPRKGRYYSELCVFIVFVCTAILMIWHYLSIGSWQMDESIAQYIISIRQPILTTLFTIITYCGEAIPIIAASAMITGVLYIKVKRKEALIFAVYMTSVWGLNELIKAIIGRPRPDFSLHLVRAHGYSLPSGHSMNVMGFTLLVLYFLWLYSKNRRLNLIVTILGICFAILIGISRVYLNVHYISDVITGWSIGAACAAVAVVIHRILCERQILCDVEK